MPMRKVTQIVLAAVISIAAFSVASAAPDSRVYPLNDHGRLILSVDDTWNEELKPAPQGGFVPLGTIGGPNGGIAPAPAEKETDGVLGD